MTTNEVHDTSGDTELQQAAVGEDHETSNKVRDGTKHSAEIKVEDNQHPHPHSNGSDAVALKSPWYGMPIYRPPRQRQRWGDQQYHPHTNWGDM